MAAEEIKNSALRHYQTSRGYAKEYGAVVTKIKPVTKVIDGKKKLYFDVHYTWPEFETTYPEMYFTRNLLTEADWNALKDKKIADLRIAWGRMSEAEDWGSGKVIALILDDGTEFEPQGARDVRPEWNDSAVTEAVAEGI